MTRYIANPNSPAAVQLVLEALHTGGLRVVVDTDQQPPHIAVAASLLGVWHTVYVLDNGPQDGQAVGDVQEQTA